MDHMPTSVDMDIDMVFIDCDGLCDGVRKRDFLHRLLDDAMLLRDKEPRAHAEHVPAIPLRPFHYIVRIEEQRLRAAVPCLVKELLAFYRDVGERVPSVENLPMLAVTIGRHPPVERISLAVL